MIVRNVQELDDEFDSIIERVKDIRDNNDWDCDGLAGMAHELRNLGDHLSTLGYELHCYGVWPASRRARHCH